MKSYANPQTLVSTDWVAQHIKDPNLIIAEVDVDTTAYNEGHISGAIGWNWQTQLCDTVRRDIISKSALESLMSSSGIANDTTIILYGDNNNWFAAWALWQLKMYGHKDVRMMNGGRKKWIAEGRELTKDIPKPRAATYKVSGYNDRYRAMMRQVQKAMEEKNVILVDVRSNDEFTGKILSPPGLPETCQRGGHIPGAKNIPWAQACNEDGTFKSADELESLYTAKGVTRDKPIVAYCRIGERSSHTWFVLNELLGYPNVSNYDGSWTEWGNMVGARLSRKELKLLKAEEYKREVQDLYGIKIEVTSYKIGNTYYCHVSNTDPGATIAHAEGVTQKEAEQSALEKARKRLSS